MNMNIKTKKYKNMKQIFTLAAAALMAMSASAENTLAKETLSLVKINDSFKVSVQNSPSLLKAKKAKAEASTLDCFLGDFVHSQWCLDPDSYDDWIGSNCDVHILDNGDGTVTIKNILGWGDIQAAYDADEEALVAPGNQFLFESSYGNVGLCAFTINADDEVEFTDDDLLFYLDDENRFEILNDGIAMVLTDGNYAGYMLNSLYMFNQFDRVNATMSWTDYYGDLCEYGVAIDGTAEDGYVDVYGFGNVSCVAVVIDGEEASIPEGQSVFFHSNYGMFYVYPFDPATSLVSEGDVMGSYNDATKTIVLDPLIAFEPNTGTVYDTFENATIQWNGADTPTAISDLKAETSSRAFDLQGRPVSTVEQGLYIVNGKLYSKL